MTICVKNLRNWRVIRRVECGLSIKLKRVPELLPAGFGRATEKNVAAFGGFLVNNAQRICVLRGQRAGIEVGFDKSAGKTYDDEGLRRWAAIAALPGRVDAADGVWQSTVRPIEVNGAYFTVIFRQDAEVRARFGRQGIANLREG